MVNELSLNPHLVRQDEILEIALRAHEAEIRRAWEGEHGEVYLMLRDDLSANAALELVEAFIQSKPDGFSVKTAHEVPPVITLWWN